MAAHFELTTHILLHAAGETTPTPKPDQDHRVSA
jgi:hypothetical protein